MRYSCLSKPLVFQHYMRANIVRRAGVFLVLLTYYRVAALQSVYYHNSVESGLACWNFTTCKTLDLDHWIRVNNELLEGMEQLVPRCCLVCMQAKVLFSVIWWYSDSHIVALVPWQLQTLPCLWISIWAFTGWPVLYHSHVCFGFFCVVGGVVSLWTASKILMQVFTATA